MIVRPSAAPSLWNLLDNAVKYSPDERQVQMSVSCSNGRVEVTVRDHGSGIAKEDIEAHVRKVLSRNERKRSKGQKERASGLAMVKEIVEAHGGTVPRPAASWDQGSEFTMVLPCRES